MDPNTRNCTMNFKGLVLKKFLLLTLSVLLILITINTLMRFLSRVDIPDYL